MTASELLIPLDDPYANFDPMAQFKSSVAGDVRNPYPAFIEKRKNTPVERRVDTLYEGVDRDAYWVYPYEDVAYVMRENEAFSSSSIGDMMGIVMGSKVIVGIDEPEHKRYRALVAQAFRSKNLAHWEEELVRPVVNETIDHFAGDDRTELVSQLTFRYPVQVIAAILGLPRGDYGIFHRRAMALLNVAIDPDAGLAAAEDLRIYLAEIVEERRREPRRDVISDLVAAEVDGEKLTEEEILSFLRLLLPAGAETTYRAAGSFIFGLLTHPDQMEALKADRSLFPQAIEESIRWETPLLITSRRATRDTEVHGVTIPAGAEIVVGLGSANHDETHWDDPESFNIFREIKPGVAFGVGPHMCLGMHLARMEMRVVVETLFDRFPNMRLDPDGDDPHIHGENFRSPTGLPVLLK